MRNAVRQLAWVLVLLAAARTSAAEPVPLKDGGYQFNGECYQAVIDLQGRLATLQVNGQDILLPPSVNAKVYGASLVAGPEHRTPLDLPRMTIESGMVVTRGDGREVSYRFRPDGIDFLFDLPDQVHWVLHLNREVITHLATPELSEVLSPTSADDVSSFRPSRAASDPGLPSLRGANLPPRLPIRQCSVWS